MGWEHRRGEPAYFYRSIRTLNGPRKVYFGHGTEACHAERSIRLIREERDRIRAEIAEFRSAAESARRIADTGRLLIELWLRLQGYRKHRGQWRRKRLPREN